jgi:putative FmdB family regulatory protein
MPIYEYACRSCEHRFEELVSRYGTLVACPQCTSGDVSQLLSTFSARTVGGDQPAPRVPAGGGGGGCCGGGCGCRH